MVSNVGSMIKAESARPTKNERSDIENNLKVLFDSY